MIRSLFVLILYIEWSTPLQKKDCGVLSLVCKKDPGCRDEIVFFTKCIQSLEQTSLSDVYPLKWKARSLSGRRLSQESRVYNNIRDEADGGSEGYLHDRKIQNLKDVYSDYQKESLRESLYLIKNKLQNKRDLDEDSDGDYVRLVDNSVVRQGDNLIQSPILNADESRYDVGNVKDTRYSSEDKQSVIDKAFKLVRSLISKRKNRYGILHPSVTSDSSPVNVRRKAGKSIHFSLSNVHNDFKDVNSLANSKSISKKEGSEDIHGHSYKVFNDSATDKRDDEIVTVYTKESKIVPAEAPHTSDESDKLLSGDESSQSNGDADRVEVAVPVYIKSNNDLDEENEKENEEDAETKADTDEEDRGYLVINTSERLSKEKAGAVGKVLQNLLWNIGEDKEVFKLDNIGDSTVSYRMLPDASWFKFGDNAGDVAQKINADEKLRSDLNAGAGVSVLSAAESEPLVAAPPPTKVKRKGWGKLTLFAAVIAASVLGILLAATIVFFIRKRGKNNLTPLILRRQEAVQDYQELCRTQMSVANSPHSDDDKENNGNMKPWNDDQSPYNMDITTGHVILAYMEDHLKNENRLNKEWEDLCSYKTDDSETIAGSDIRSQSRNRYIDVLPYDHNRVKLRESSNLYHSDYINASFITDADPRNPTYIATQGPLDNTVNDFWQMIWEQGIVVIINLTKLSDAGLPQCHHYWPEDGCAVYHIYEVQLISEHIWCDDFLIRSLYLKNLQTGETRTVTQFHYLTWPDLNIPSSPKPLLEFRRKVNKCYRGHAPVVVHCNNGVGRTGTYILLDMVLNKMIKGTKEIDIAATLEHLRDQRQDCVKTKGQFEFALLAVAEEVTAILSAVSR